MSLRGGNTHKLLRQIYLLYIDSLWRFTYSTGLTTERIQVVFNDLFVCTLWQETYLWDSVDWGRIFLVSLASLCFLVSLVCLVCLVTLASLAFLDSLVPLVSLVLLVSLVSLISLASLVPLASLVSLISPSSKSGVKFHFDKITFNKLCIISRCSWLK